MVFLPEGYRSIHISSHICMRMCIVCACFHVRYQGSSLAFISYIHFFCVAKVDAPQQHDHHHHNHHHDDDLMIINTVNTPTSNGERRWDPPGRARPTERICLQTKCDIWLERKRCGPKPCGDGLATLRVTNTGAHTYIIAVLHSLRLYNCQWQMQW